MNKIANGLISNLSRLVCGAMKVVFIPLWPIRRLYKSLWVFEWTIWNGRRPVGYLSLDLAPLKIS